MKTINIIQYHTGFFSIKLQGSSTVSERKTSKAERAELQFFSGIPNSEIYGFRDSVLIFLEASNHPSNIFLFDHQKGSKSSGFLVWDQTFRL